VKNSKNWKRQINYWFLNIHQEILKTSVIGKKLLTASRTNSHLKETYEELGRLVEKDIDQGILEWDSPKARAHLNTIRACKKDLAEIENQVHRIKFAAGPEDIAKIDKK
jgi:DNA-binding TFAR19-related protein (PDSD5 family)